MIFLNNTAKLNYNNIDNFLETLFSKNINLELEYESDYVTKQPSISITLNGIDVFKEQCKTSNTLKLSLPALQKENNLKISMMGKLDNDTLVENGKIVKDTYVKLCKLHINNYSLLDDYDFFYQKFVYIDQDGHKHQAMSGFWSNSSLILNFDMPFDMWYNSVSNKNRAVSDTLKHQEAENLEKLISTLEKSVMKLK